MIDYAEESHHVFSVQLYTEEECRAVVGRVSGLGAWEVAQVRESTDEGGFDSFTRPEVRSTAILRCEEAAPLFAAFDEKMRVVVKPLVRQVWGADFAVHGGTQILRYSEGGHYVAHSDAGEDLQDRYFSVVCYLNDDFDGGQTSFPYLDYAARPRRGRAIIFPSRYLHRAEPVTRGRKYVVVSWLLGPRPVPWIRA